MAGNTSAPRCGTLTASISGRSGSATPSSRVESRCATPHLYEQRIKEMFKETLGILMGSREEVIGDCREVMDALADSSAIEAELEAVSREKEVTAGLIQRMVDENATRKLDQHDFRKKYDGYASRYTALESREDSMEKER